MQKRKPSSFLRNSRVFRGADGRIRTGDLILTKDALYRLSYISIGNEEYFNRFRAKMQAFSESFLRFFTSRMIAPRFSETIPVLIKKLTHAI